MHLAVPSMPLVKKTGWSSGVRETLEPLCHSDHSEMQAFQCHSNIQAD